MEDVKHIVITGATGFIGQHLLEDLLPLNYRVTIITRNVNKPTRIKSDKINTIKADLTDRESLLKAFECADVVVNLAAELKDTSVIEKTNVVGTQNLVDAAKANNVKQIIHLSSVGVVGMQYSISPVIVNELTDCDPKNEYERTKLSSETILKNSVKDTDVNLLILRPTNVFGEYHPKKALHQLFNRLKSTSVFFLSEDAVVNYVYVKDVTAVIINAIQNPVTNGVYNIGEATTLRTFIGIMASLLNKNIKIIVLPKFLFGILNLSGKTQLKALSNAVSYSDEKLKKLMPYPHGIANGLSRTFKGLEE